jgi:small subunit ribosomal protein S19
MAIKQDTEVIVKSKDVFYRGINLEDLKKMEIRESAKYLPSRSRRTVLRHFQIIEEFVKRCEASFATKKKIKTHLRDIVVVPRLVGYHIAVYNGKVFNDVNITHEMIGHRLGEFSLTRSKVAHSAAGIGATKSSKALKK